MPVWREGLGIPVTIVNSIAEFNIDWGAIMATGMLLAVPPTLFTFCRSDFGDIDMEVANRIRLEFLLHRFVALDIR